MRVYLDMCCFNRQFDEKTDENVMPELRNIIYIQKEIVQGNIELATSFMLHYENYRKKNHRQRDAIDFFLKTYRKIYIGVDFSEKLKILSEEIIAAGIKPKDAYHIASAILADCDYFVTVDKKLLRYSSDKIIITNPINFVEVYGNV
ncbi:MAG: hypothetical protein IJU91_01955 [Selenomonadaceae bacterium]|nr:hypothetical protein [Selenomonadaceae bacterium]